jgi:hypothetical protein
MILTEQDMHQELIQIHKEHIQIILDILKLVDSNNRVSNSQDLEVNLKVSRSHLVNKAITHNNNLTLISHLCKDKTTDSQVSVNLQYSQDMDSLQFNQVTANSLCIQVTDNHKFNQLMDSHQCSQVTVNLPNKCMEINHMVSQLWLQDMVNLKCNSQVTHQSSNIQDNNMDDNLNKYIMEIIRSLYKAINQKLIA